MKGIDRLNGMVQRRSSLGRAAFSKQGVWFDWAGIIGKERVRWVREKS